MLLKPSSKIHPSMGLSQQRARSNTPSQQRPVSQTPTIRKKFTPKVNKSFTCYKDQVLPKHSRASSLDKTKMINYSFKHTRTKSLKSSGKILASAKEISIIDSAKIEMNYGNYTKALDFLNKYLKTEVNNLEAIYSRGVCFMHLNKHDHAVKDFLKVMEIDPVFDRQMYIAIYMCYTNLNQQSNAIKYLSKGLRKFPGFVQGLLLRGQIYNKLKKYQKALQDFKKVLTQDGHNISVLPMIAESCIGLKDFVGALKVLNISIMKPEFHKVSMVLRIQTNYAMGKYEETIADIEKLLQESPEEENAFFYKGRVFFDLKRFADSALCFEQAIQCSSNLEVINNSLYYLGVMKINERDFYGALHTFERSPSKNQTAELKALHNYTEGVISLMKRKLEEGISIFSLILTTDTGILQEYILNCFENRGFAHFSLGKYESALSDFLSARELGKIELASEFNITMSQGILAAQKKNNAEALKFFKQSKEIFPKNIMPDLCRASIFLHAALSSSENMHFLVKAESLIEKILNSRETESEVMFYRSIIRFCMKNYEESLESMKKAIEKADENFAGHYMQRGFCHAALKKYEEAVQDFTIAIQLNENIKEIYIYRGISAFLQDDLQLALEDFLNLSKKYPEDENLQIKIAKLLMVTGSFSESLEIFKSISNKTEEISYLEAQNYLSLNNYKKALKCLKSIHSLEIESQLEIDKIIIQLFIDSSVNNKSVFEAPKLISKLKQSTGKIFTKKYLYWIIGTILLYNKECIAATSYFQAVLEFLHDEEPEIFADSITIEEENCEILYNLALCSLFTDSADSKSHALMIFEELAEVLNEKHRGQLLFLSAIIELTLKNKAKAEKLLKEASKCDPETISPFLDNEETTVLPLHTSNEFSNLFPLIPITIENFPIIYVRPAIVLPHLNLEYDLNDVLKEIKSFYGINNINPRPEAPWLLRVKGSIQFTEAFLDISHDLETEAEENTKIIEESVKEFKKVSKSHSYLRDKSFVVGDSRKDINGDGLGMDFERKIKNICND